ncbi:MAG: ribonuclease Z [Clostridia bacterium]|nr:ribonuclease Z [Clostridia bacterium]
MKITFLGTGAGLPTADRHCASILLETQGRLYLIDAGAPIVDIFAKSGRRVEDIKGVFLSHFHLDHCAGAIQLVDLAMNYYRNSEFTLYTPSQQEVVALRTLIAASGASCESDRIKLVHYLTPQKDSLDFDDGYLRLTAIKTRHCENNPASPIKSYAFYVEVEGKRLLFTNDVSMHFSGDDFPKIAYEGHYDLVVAECGHVTASELMDKMRNVDTDVLAVNHINIEVNYAELKAIQSGYKCKMYLPEDNDTIEI